MTGEQLTREPPKVRMTTREEIKERFEQAQEEAEKKAEKKADSADKDTLIGPLANGAKA